MKTKYQKHEVSKKFLEKWQKKIDFVAKLFQVPAALIMRVHDDQIEVLVSSHSEGNPYEKGEMADLETNLYCETVMAAKEQLLVPNALHDKDWAENPDIELGMISYLGIPLIWPDGDIFGTICVLDEKTRDFPEKYQSLLWVFKELIESDFIQSELHKNELLRSERNYREIFNAGSDAIFIQDAESGKIVDMNQSVLDMFGYERSEIISLSLAEIGSKGALNNLADAVRLSQIEKNDVPQVFEAPATKKTGEVFWAELILKNAWIGGVKRVLIVVRDITDRKNTEKEKLETEKKLKAIFNHRFQLTGLLDSEGRLLMINDVARNMAGLDSGQLVGKYFWHLPHWSHSRELQLEVKKAIQTVINGIAVSFETTHADFNGNIRNIEFSMTPVQDDNGNVVYIVPEGIDITEKKQSENRLIESERNYREIYNSSSDAIIIHDAVTEKIIDVNQTMTEMFGYDYQEALQLEIGDISSGRAPFTQDDAFNKVKQAVNEGPQLFEWVSRNKNGDCFWTEVALRNTTIGGKGRVLAVVRDISRRKKLDSELHLIKHTIEHSAYPFEWIQKDSRFFYVNEAACRSLGYTQEELCTLHVYDIDPDFTKETWPEFWEKLKANKTLTFESRHRRNNGDIFPVEITANHLEFEGQEHVFAYVRDISDRIKYEKEQKNLEKQLQQAQKMEAIGTLAGGIAHDFNNILSAIIGFSEVALGDIPKESPVYSYIQQIAAAGHRAGNLVNQILTFSRRQDRELKPLKVQLIIKEALKLLRSTIPTTIEIKSYIDPNCGLVLADPTQIQQIMMNLCTNAYHAMGHKGGILSVNLRPINRISTDNFSGGIYLEPGPYLELEISDTGHGISNEHLARVFDPYFTTKEKGEGTGLGLAIVHSIVNDFKGNIDVKSKVGKGTTFTIYMPVIKETRPARGALKETGPLPDGEERILFVDDEKGVVEFSKIMIQSLGYNFTGFTDSKQALEAFLAAPHDFDLIITDMTMPNLSGQELVREVLMTRPDIPVILCTGYSEYFTPEQVKKMGIREYMKKPVLKRELATTIRKVLDENKSN